MKVAPMRQKKSTIVILLNLAILLAFLSSFCTCQNACKFKLDGKHYFLDGLKAAFPNDIILKYNDYTFYYRVCDTVQNAKCFYEKDGNNYNNTAMCQEMRSSGDYYSLGSLRKSVAEKLLDGELGFRLVILGGDAERETLISFRCSDSEGNLTFITEFPSKFYNFEWITPAACPIY